MLTAVFEAAADVVELHARKHLPDAIIVAVGRLTAVQSPRLSELDVATIREIAELYNLPLRGIVDKPPFEASSRNSARSVNARPSPLALPPARSHSRGQR